MAEQVQASWVQSHLGDPLLLFCSEAIYLKDLSRENMNLESKVTQNKRCQLQQLKVREETQGAQNL